MHNISKRRWARDDRLARIPWVSRVSGELPCEGIKWQLVALKHLYPRGGRQAEGIPERARCKLRAKWHFVALPIGRAKTGNYCLHHLPIAGDVYDDELTRLRQWLATQPDYPPPPQE